MPFATAGNSVYGTAIDASMSSTPTITVASYNMHRAIGLDGRRDPHRVLKVLQEIDADVVALRRPTSASAGAGRPCRMS